MTLSEIISRARALKTMHGESIPKPGTKAREEWLLERELLKQLEESMLRRLNESREVRA